jgi:hypothetical protein
LWQTWQHGDFAKSMSSISWWSMSILDFAIDVENKPLWAATPISGFAAFGDFLTSIMRHTSKPNSA